MTHIPALGESSPVASQAASMHTTSATGWRANFSPNATARLVGALLLITMVLGGFAQGYIAGGLIVSGNAAATAGNIVAHESLFRLAFAIYLVEMSCQIAMTVLFYELLEPVNRSAALIAAAFGLVGCTIKTLSRLFFFAPLLVLGGAPYLSAFEPTQLHTLSYLFLRVQYQAETIAMVFFGLNTLVNGYLVLQSTFLPRVLGLVAMVGGLGWMLYLYEPFALRLQSLIVGMGVLGAFMLVLWLLVKGVNENRWYARAGAAAHGRPLPW